MWDLPESGTKPRSPALTDRLFWVSLVAQMVQNLPAMQETQVLSLGWENLLEKGMVSHSSVLAWRNPWTEEPDWLPTRRLQRVEHDWVTNTSTFFKSDRHFSRNHTLNFECWSSPRPAICCKTLFYDAGQWRPQLPVRYTIKRGDSPYT